ncbi:uncharacterized protein LOC126681527 [Mercurialis annua]|uniref:uncharacterized protein LOC126681527 n=1 Tax=Mercurialis annua TaxID=3986 RepID=UPI002160ECFB|nr:uncharacterized protein LOC126681527 [Mercurialis annua]
MVSVLLKSWKKIWGKLGLIDFHQIKTNLFAFTFESEEGKLKAMADGPITSNKHPLIVEEWRRNMSFDITEIASVPVWVKFPLLPWKFWNPNSLSSIASTLGKPLFADRYTRERSRLAYARILIDLRLKGIFPDVVVIEDSNGEQTTQFVEYEWKPILYEVCNKLGHRNCEKKQIWLAKTSDKDAVKIDEKTQEKQEEAPDVVTSIEKPNIEAVKIVEDATGSNQCKTPPTIQDDGFQLITNRKLKNKILSQERAEERNQKSEAKSGGMIKPNSNDRIPAKRLIKPLDRGK